MASSSAHSVVNPVAHEHPLDVLLLTAADVLDERGGPRQPAHDRVGQDGALARRVTDLAPAGDGQTVEIAVQVLPTVRDFLTRRTRSVGPAALAVVLVVALITITAVLVIRRRRMREG